MNLAGLDSERGPRSARSAYIWVVVVVVEEDCWGSLVSAMVATSLGVGSMQFCRGGLRVGAESNGDSRIERRQHLLFWPFCFFCFLPLPFFAAANEKLRIRMEKALRLEEHTRERRPGELARRRFEFF